jgi:hypothetical protein
MDLKAKFGDSPNHSDGAQGCPVPAVARPKKRCLSGFFEKGIERTFGGIRHLAHDMRIDHRRFNAFMAEETLDFLYVHPVHKQVRGDQAISG